MTRRARAASALTTSLILAACTGADTAEAGGFLVTDSAGITLIRNPGDADWTAAPRPTVVEDLRIGVIEGAPEYQFGAISGVDVGTDGRIYVLDRQASNVRMFDAAGGYVGTIGREGQGPGELSGGTALMVTPGDTVWVVDGSVLSGRLVGFAPDGAPAGTTPLARDLRNLPVRWERTPQGVFAVQIRRVAGDAPDLLLVWDPRSGVADTVLSLEPLERTGSLRLYEPAPTWTLLADGGLVVGRNDEARLRVMDFDGTVERVVTRAIPPRPISDEENAAEVERMREQLRAIPVPQTGSPQVQQRLRDQRDEQIAGVTVADHWPVYSSVMAGPGGTFWTRRFFTPAEVEAAGDESAPNLWDVYDREGRLLGPVELPRTFVPRRAVGDHLYGVDRDELGVSYVVRLRIAPPP